MSNIISSLTETLLETFKINFKIHEIAYIQLQQQQLIQKWAEPKLTFPKNAQEVDLSRQVHERCSSLLMIVIVRSVYGPRIVLT